MLTCDDLSATVPHLRRMERVVVLSKRVVRSRKNRLMSRPTKVVESILFARERRCSGRYSTDTPTYAAVDGSFGRVGRSKIWSRCRSYDAGRKRTDRRPVPLLVLTYEVPKVRGANGWAEQTAKNGEKRRKITGGVAGIKVNLSRYQARARVRLTRELDTRVNFSQSPQNARSMPHTSNTSSSFSRYSAWPDTMLLQLMFSMPATSTGERPAAGLDIPSQNSTPSSQSREL